MQIHENIRFIRQLKGWSQEEMANKLYMSLNGYGSIERGETDVRLSRLEKIANIFEISLLQLFGLNEKNVFNSNNNTGDNVQNQYWCNGSPKKKELEHELEKCILQNKNYEKEIVYLNEIIALMKNQNMV